MRSKKREQYVALWFDKGQPTIQTLRYANGDLRLYELSPAASGQATFDSVKEAAKWLRDHPQEMALVSLDVAAAILSVQ